MPTQKERIQFTPESNEKELLATLAEEEGVSMSRMMGILIRRAWKQRERELKRNVQAYSTSPPQTSH